MTPEVQVIIIMIAFLVLLISGHPLAFSLGGISILFGLIFWNNPNVINMFVSSTNNLCMNPGYVSAPLFIFMGALLEKSGVADDLFDSMYIVLGRLKGGLAITVVVICTLLAAATGIIGAAIGLMSMLALPAMMRYNYQFKFATGTIMAAGCLGQLIPPSVVMIVYASQAQVPIGRLFAGGIGAGLMLAALFVIYIVIRTAIDPSLAPVIDKSESDKYTTKQKVAMTFRSIVPTIALIVVVLGSILKGIATPTEGAAVGVVGALLLVLVNRRFSIDMLLETCYSTTKTVAMVFAIILSASMFCSMFLGLGGGKVIENLVFTIGGTNPWVIVCIIFAIVFVMGMFMDSYGIVMIGVPIFTPIVASLGFDPIWFGVMFTVMMLISYMSPPFAYAAFFIKGAAQNPDELPLDELYYATFPYLGVYFVGVLLLCLFPQIITFLPGVMY